MGLPTRRGIVGGCPVPPCGNIHLPEASLRRSGSSPRSWGWPSPGCWWDGAQAQPARGNNIYNFFRPRQLASPARLSFDQVSNRIKSLGLLETRENLMANREASEKIRHRALRKSKDGKIMQGPRQPPGAQAPAAGKCPVSRQGAFGHAREGAVLGSMGSCVPYLRDIRGVL